MTASCRPETVGPNLASRTVELDHAARASARARAGVVARGHARGQKRATAGNVLYSGSESMNTQMLMLVLLPPRTFERDCTESTARSWNSVFQNTI